LKIFASSAYLAEIERFKKKKKSLYSKVEEDLHKWFEDHFTFESIFESNYFLRDVGLVRLIKIRFPNSNTNKGASSGYRLILLCNKKTQSVGLIYIFPKTGKFGKTNIDDQQEKKLLDIFFSEFKSGILVRQTTLETLVEEAAKKAGR
jgi:mRNA-degrading endonuclease RelE of RelBE toxin-antitoxin system